MATDPLTPVSDILASGDFDQLIDRTETVVLEVKGATPYNLDTPSGRYELAKDISAFANAEGGHLLIGLKTGKLTNERADRVQELNLIPEASFNVSKITGILREYIYPQIGNLDVRWHGSSSDKALGLGIIFVPTQAVEQKPFLVTNVVEENEQQKQIVVGIFQRGEADNVPTTPADIHKMIQRGNDAVLQRTIRIEKKLDAALRKPAPSGTPVASAQSVLAQRLRDLKSE